MQSLSYIILFAIRCLSLRGPSPSINFANYKPSPNMLHVNTVKAILSPKGTHLIPGLKKVGGGLLERGREGGLIKIIKRGALKSFYGS